VNFGDQVYVNSPQDIEYWVEQMQRRQIKPTIAIFDVAMIENAMHYVRRGAIAEPPFFNLVLGQPGAIAATPRNLMFLIDSLPQGAPWQAMGHGEHNLAVTLWAIAFGGHARAGYEDSILIREGERATSNAALIDRVVRIAREAERGIASPREARLMLGLEPSR
jgi:3-keto-5-aminohexanoate cleavage enzyme